MKNAILPNSPVSMLVEYDNKIRPLMFALWLTAMLPCLQALATWDMDGRLSPQAFALRHLSLPVLAGELLIIWLAARESMSIGDIVSRIPKIASVLLVIWIFVAIITALIEPNQRAISVFITARYLTHGLFFAALLSLYNNAPGLSTERWLQILALGAAAYVTALVIFCLIIPNREVFQWALRIPSATNIRQIGYYVAIFTVAPLTLLLFGADKYSWRYGLCITGLVAFISWSGSRGALIGLIAGSLVSLVFIKKRPSRNALLATGGYMFSGMGLSIFLPAPTPAFGIFRILSSVQGNSDISSGRLDVWLKTIDHIRTGPFFGHGSGRFNWNMHEAYGMDFNHPHQFILQYVYDWGMVGGAAALLSLLVLAFATLRKARDHPLAGYAAISAIITTVGIAMIDGALFYPISIMLTLALVVPLFAKASVVVGSEA